MAARAEPGAVRVTVCRAVPGAVWRCELQLPAGSTVGDAIEASGFRGAHPGIDPYAHGVGVYGALREAAHPLEDGDRVEILRPLTYDPMESRRRRALHRAARGQARPARAGRPPAPGV